MTVLLLFIYFPIIAPTDFPPKLGINLNSLQFNLFLLPNLFKMADVDGLENFPNEFKLF